MLAAFQRQLGVAQQHLRGQPPGCVTGQPAQHASVRQPLQKQAGIGAAASGHGAASVNQPFLQLLQQTGSGQNLQKPFLL